MLVKKYLYAFGYNEAEKELSKLEAKCLFGIEDKDRLLFSDRKIEPSHSAYIKYRLDIISFDKDYMNLIRKVNSEDIISEGFKVEYVVYNGDDTAYVDRLDKLRDIGFSIKGYPNYKKPRTIFVLCYYEGIWYFGEMNKNNYTWLNHNKKPCSYSSSISINIAKSLVNIATKGDNQITVLDACCGVGTIMLEACFAGFKIEGCDINEKISQNAIRNLEYFDYNAKVYFSNISNISNTYDVAIVDLPYNLSSSVTEADVKHIINASAKISNRLIIVSISDISKMIQSLGLSILNYCIVNKNGRANFNRKIWVCN